MQLNLFKAYKYRLYIFKVIHLLLLLLFRSRSTLNSRPTTDLDGISIKIV